MYSKRLERLWLYIPNTHHCKDRMPRGDIGQGHGPMCATLVNLPFWCQCIHGDGTRLQLVMLCCQSTSALGKDSGAGFCYRGLAMGQHFSDDFPDRNSPMSERMICL